jgi:drug/metabolite transporter (DMT)-like permease
VRNIIGGLVLIPVILVIRKINGEQRPFVTKIELIGGICCGIALFAASSFQQQGILYTTVGKAGFITAMYILLVPILGLFMKKRVGAKVWLGVLLSVIGLYLLCMTSKRFSLSKGDFLVLICAGFFSIHILVIDHFSPQVDGVRLSCIQFLVCGVISTAIAFIFENPNLGTIVSGWLPILYAGVFSSGVAYTLQIVGQKNMDPTVASLILSLESVFSVLAGWLILHQTLSLRELSGCVLMFLAIILAQLPEKGKSL